MKKKLALMLATALAAAGLAACGGSGTADTKAAGSQAEGAGEKALSGDGSGMVVAWWGNQVRNECTQAILELYSQQSPGVTFDGQFSEWADYWNKLATAAAGHSMLDIVQMDYKYIQQYVNNDLLVDLTPYIKNGTIDVSNCNEDVLNSDKAEDGLYTICNGINAPALLHNKTVLDEAGITVRDNMTTDELIALCKEIRKKTRYKINIIHNSGENFIEYFLRANDVVMFEDGELGGTADDCVSYFKLYEDGIKDGWVVDPSIFAEGTTGSVGQDPMVYGPNPETTPWCAFNYANQLAAVRSAAPEGVEIAITTWPLADPVKSDYLKPNQFFAITRDSANPDEAAKVLDFITNSMECNEILLGKRGIPLSSSVADSAAPKMDETSQGVIRFINDAVSGNSSQINPPAADGSSEVNDLLNKLEEQVCYDQVTAEDAGWQLFTEGSKIAGSKRNR